MRVNWMLLLQSLVSSKVAQLPSSCAGVSSCLTLHVITRWCPSGHQRDYLLILLLVARSRMQSCVWSIVTETAAVRVREAVRVRAVHRDSLICGVVNQVCS